MINNVIISLFVVVENDVFKKLLSEWLRTQFFSDGFWSSGVSLGGRWGWGRCEIRSYRMRMETSGNSLEESMEECRVEEGESCDFCACVNELWDITPRNMIISNTVSQSHYKDTLQAQQSAGPAHWTRLGWVQWSRFNNGVSCWLVLFPRLWEEHHVLCVLNILIMNQDGGAFGRSGYSGS